MTAALAVAVPAPRSARAPEGETLRHDEAPTAASPAVARREAAARIAARAPDRSAVPWSTLAREGLLLGSGLGVYQASRLLGGRHVEAALGNARGVLRIERLLGLPSEQSLQSLLLGVEPLVRAANGYYAAAHLPVTSLALLWLLLARPAAYRRARAALLAVTAAALAVYVLVPVAPPRMLAGFVDTAAVFGQSVYGDAGPSALANQYAALPSLRVGWALLTAIACASAARTRWRWLWLLHPAVTVLVVIGTANHYWVDAIAAAVLGLAAWALAGRTRPLARVLTKAAAGGRSVTAVGAGR